MPKQKRRQSASPVQAPATPPAGSAQQQQQQQQQQQRRYGAAGTKPGTRDGLVAKLDKGYGKASNYHEIMGFMLDQAVRRPPARPPAPDLAPDLAPNPWRGMPPAPLGAPRGSPPARAAPRPSPARPGPHPEHPTPARCRQVMTNTFDYNGLLSHPDVHRRVCELLQQAIQQAQQAKPGTAPVTMAEVAEAVLSPKSDASGSVRTWSLGACSASSSLHDHEHEEAEAPEPCLSSASESPHSEPPQTPAFSPSAAGRAASFGGSGGAAAPGSSAASEKHHHEQEQEEQRRLEQMELHEKLARQLLKQLVQEQPGSPAGGAAESPRPDLASALFGASPPHHYTGALPLSRRNSSAAGQGGGSKPQPADVAADHQHRQQAFLEVRRARPGPGGPAPAAAAAAAAMHCCGCALRTPPAHGALPLSSASCPPAAPPDLGARPPPAAGHGGVGRVRGLAAAALHPGAAAHQAAAGLEPGRGQPGDPVWHAARARAAAAAPAAAGGGQAGQQAGRLPGALRREAGWVGWGWPWAGAGSAAGCLLGGRWLQRTPDAWLAWLLMLWAAPSAPAGPAGPVAHCAAAAVAAASGAHFPLDEAHCLEADPQLWHSIAEGEVGHPEPLFLSAWAGSASLKAYLQVGRGAPACCCCACCACCCCLAAGSLPPAPRSA
jgi:hypothetical protein